MSELNRYLFKQLLGPLGFFALVFAGVLWLTQSLRLFDTLISNGQSARAFFEFSALVLPNVMLFVIPLATFAASLYTLNKLYTESELVVMLMSGRSPWALARALLIFGGFAMIALFAFTLYLIPISTTLLEDRLLEVRTELTSSLIAEGRFNHPARGVTTFIRDTNTEGQMAGIFIHDAREVPSEAFSTVTFERLAFDLSEFVPTGKKRRRKPSEYFLGEALNPTEADLSGRYQKGQFIATAHEKIVTPLLTLVLPLVALGSILAGSFRRGGFSLLWPLSYLPVVVALLVSLVLIYLSARPKRAARSQMVSP